MFMMILPRNFAYYAVWMPCDFCLIPCEHHVIFVWTVCEFRVIFFGCLGFTDCFFMVCSFFQGIQEAARFFSGVQEGFRRLRVIRVWLYIQEASRFFYRGSLRLVWPIVRRLSFFTFGQCDWKWLRLLKDLLRWLLSPQIHFFYSVKGIEDK